MKNKSVCNVRYCTAVTSITAWDSKTLKIIQKKEPQFLSV